MFCHLFYLRWFRLIYEGRFLFYAPVSIIFKQKGTEVIIKGHFGASIDFIYLIAKEQQSVRFENASGILMQEIMRKDDCV